VEATAFLAQTRETIGVPMTIVCELAGLVSRQLGARTAGRFAESVASGELPIVETERGDWARAAVLVRQYESLRLGLVDATVVAVAERLGVQTVATFDRCHFGIVRPRHGPLTLVP
jgi:uncharacterized protein